MGIKEDIAKAEALSNSIEDACKKDGNYITAAEVSVRDTLSMVEALSKGEITFTAAVNSLYNQLDYLNACVC